jgi:hypothetical protein
MKLRTLPSKLMCAVTLAAALHLPVAQAAGLSEASNAMSNASTALSNASGVLVQGSVQMLAGAGQMVVASVEVVGESTLIVLKGIGSTVEVSLKVASNVAAGVSLAIGTVVTVVTEAVGYALVAAGRTIAFIPNELGRSLLYQSRLD